MKCFGISSRKAVAMVVLATFLPIAVTPALAVSPVKIQKATGKIDFSTEGPSPFFLEGTASHLGQFTAYGEADFLPGGEEGSLIGEGIVVFESANGDLLVGVITWEVDAADDDAGGGHIHVSWRDSVEFSDGTVVSSTGRFEEERPPGIVALEYIWIGIIIGLGVFI